MLLKASKSKKPKSILYVTELSLLGYFYIPKKIYNCQIPEIQATLIQRMNLKKASSSAI